MSSSQITARAEMRCPTGPPGIMSAIARWCYRHRFVVIAAWVVLLIGLVTYTAGYIAEIVRGGIQAVAYGQHDAAAALGLNRMQEVRLILLPQALRVIIPPITSQYLNLTKNSSLAVAVGYPELVSIATTSLNQTGRAIEAISLVMLCYLTMSLLTAGIMNWYNRRAAIRER